MFTKDEIQDLADHATLEQLHTIGTRCCQAGNAIPFVGFGLPERLAGKAFFDNYFLCKQLQVDDFGIIFFGRIFKAE